MNIIQKERELELEEKKIMQLNHMKNLYGQKLGFLLCTENELTNEKNR